MAHNTDIKTGSGLDEGLIQLTLLTPDEHLRLEEEGTPMMALLTARGKDHDMTADQLEELGNTALRYAKMIRDFENKPT